MCCIQLRRCGDGVCLSSQALADAELVLTSQHAHITQSIIELSRTQDEEVGDGTTSVIILGALWWAAISMLPPDTQALLTVLSSAAGEMLHIAEPFLEQNLHPTVIVRGFMRALEDAIATVDTLAFPIDTSNREQMLKTVQSCIGTKYTARFGTLMAVCSTAV